MHGGEPLVLPLAYLRKFLALASAQFRGLDHDISLQSNLFHVSEPHIELLKEYKVSLGCSFDVMPGVRLTVDGRETERRVEKNIDVVRDAGIPLAAIVVIGRHTVHHLRKIYDHFVAKDMALRVLPLADGPSERPLESFATSFDETVTAMCDLFDYWFESDLAVSIDPLRIYVQDAIRHLLGITTMKYDRRAAGDYAFFVNVDGRLYAERDTYEVDLALGDLREQTMAEILASGSYEASLRREAALVRGKCPTCPLNDSCAGWPIISTKSRATFDEPCAVAPVVTMHIVRRLGEWGFGGAELARMYRGLQDAPVSASA
jgi:uncharacterized protein